MHAHALLPRHPVPALNVALVGGGRYVLGAAPGERFDLIVFYRGLHCPICAKYLMELERLAPEFAQRGVQIVAVSSDDESRGREMAGKVKADVVKLRFFVGLSDREVAEALGVSERTIERHWAYAKAWLARALRHGT